MARSTRRVRGAAGARTRNRGGASAPAAAEAALNAGQGRILEMVAAGAPLGETLEALVRLIESGSPGMLGSVLLLDHDGLHLRHGAAPSLPPAFSRAIEGEPIGPRAGSCGTAAFRGEPVVVEDIEQDPLWSDYRALAAAHGLRSCWSTPIFDDRRRLLGTFAMYRRVPARPTRRDLRMIELATHTAAIAIAKTNVEHERARLVRMLGERVKELTVLHEAAGLLQGGAVIDPAFLSSLAALLPRAWQYPEACAARIRCGDLEVTTPGWRDTRWLLSANLVTGDGRAGSIEVAYREERPPADEGPFLAEERRLIDSLADMLSAQLERIRVQAALRGSEAMFRSIFENAAIGMTLVNMDEQVIRCNPALTRMLGYSEAELNGRTIAELTHPDDVEANRELYRSLREGRIDHFHMDKRYVRKDGAIIWGRLSVSRVRLEGAAPGLTIGMVEDITTRKEAEEKVRHLAYYEPITDLPNRASLNASLARAIDEARALGHSVALLLLNLNNFRDINSALGHHNGDVLLKRVAASLRAALWESDLVASLGGDEYAIMLAPVADRADVEPVLGKITASLKPPLSIAGVPVNVEASLGIALYPEHGDSAGVIWQRADVALRTARERQVSCLYYAPGLDRFDPQQLTLLGELRDAIDRDELTLHYQPKIDLPSGTSVAVEALVRWQHPAHGLLYPDRFIPLAERTHLINRLTTWVLTNALRQGEAWRRDGLEIGLSVNLSVRNLHDSNLCAEILELARNSGFPPSLLTVEITESAIMADAALAKSVLAQLHGAGIQLSIDDFGVGQSSLAYLKDLPIGRMKIDKSFVMDFDNPRNAAIVRSAVDLGHNLGLNVTAEGVENERVFLALRAMGCDLAQGYYFARPMPADQLAVWIRESPWKCRS